MRAFTSVVLFLCCILNPVHAEGWYINKRGEPTVMSDDGYWYMLLSKSMKGDVNAYLLPRNGIECKASGSSSSMYVNGTKLVAELRPIYGNVLVRLYTSRNKSPNW